MCNLSRRPLVFDRAYLQRQDGGGRDVSCAPTDPLSKENPLPEEEMKEPDFLKIQSNPILEKTAR